MVSLKYLEQFKGHHVKSTLKTPIHEMTKRAALTKPTSAGGPSIYALNLTYLLGLPA